MNDKTRANSDLRHPLKSRVKLGTTIAGTKILAVAQIRKFEHCVALQNEFVVTLCRGQFSAVFLRAIHVVGGE